MKFLGVELDVLKLAIRNTANTFKSTFSSAATANRTITLQDKSYTLADNADLVDASSSVRGFVNTSDQQFSGVKTFENLKSNTRISINNNTGFSGSTQASFWKDTTYGLCLRAASGSSYELVFFDPVGNLAVGIGNGFAYVGANLAIFSQNKFYFDGGSDTYLVENTANNVQIVSGGISTLNSKSGKVGIGTDVGSYDLSLPFNTNASIGQARNATVDTSGNSFTITASGATPGASNKNGGTLTLSGGISTGTGESGVQLKGYVVGSSGTADNSSVVGFEVLGNKWAFNALTPTVTQTGWSTSGITTARALTSSATLTDAVNVLGTLIADLKTKGIILS